MVGTCAERFFFMEAPRDEQLLGFGFRNHAVGSRAHTAIRTCPVDDEELPSWLQYPFYLSYSPLAMIKLEEGIRKYDRIEHPIPKRRASPLLEISPDRLYVPEAPFAREIMDMLEYVLLDVYGIYVARWANYSAGRDRIVSRAGAEVTHTHPITQTELEDVVVGIAKVHAPSIASEPA